MNNFDPNVNLKVNDAPTVKYSPKGYVLSDIKKLADNILLIDLKNPSSIVHTNNVYTSELVVKAKANNVTIAEVGDTIAIEQGAIPMIVETSEGSFLLIRQHEVLFSY